MIYDLNDKLITTDHRKENTMEYSELISILSEMHPDVDFDKEDKLIDTGILDSFDIVSLVADLGSQYDVKVPAGRIIPKNFNSAKAMFAMIQELEDE